MPGTSQNLTASLADRLPGPMQQVASFEYLGNSLARWGVAAVIFLGGFLLLRLVKAFAASRLDRLANRTRTHVDDLLRDLVRQTRTLFLFLLALYLGCLVLELPAGVELGLKRTFSILLFIQIGLWAHHILTFSIRRRLTQEGGSEATHVAVLTLFGFFGQLAVWSLVLLLALDNLGFDITALIAGLGVGGIAVGLALQNVLKDTFASLSIILDKPFVVGDFIVVGDLPGTVERIGIKTTRVRALSGEQLVFGNDDLLSSRIRNFKRLFERRILFTFGVLYQTPVDQLERIGGMVREVIEGCDRARFDRAHFKGFGDSSLDFEVVYYVLGPEYNLYMDIQERINLGLCRRFAAEGIEFAYPTRTLFVQGEGGPIRVDVVAPELGSRDREPAETQEDTTGSEAT